MRKISDSTRPNSRSDCAGENTNSGDSPEMFADIKSANRKVRLRKALQDYGIKIEKNFQRPAWSNNIICPFPNHKGAKERTPSFAYCFVSDHFHCLAGDTRVITYDGTYAIRDLSDKTCLVIGKNNNWTEGHFKYYGKQQLWKLDLSRNGQKKTIYTTEDHRWFVKCGKGRYNSKEVITRNLKANYRLVSKFTSCHTKQMVLSPFGIAHGIIFGDGTANKAGSFGYLQGDKDNQLKKWFPLNKITPDNSIDGKSIVHNLPKFFKEKPPIDEAAQYLFGWLAGYFAADGCVDEDGTIIINSADKENLEFVRTICTRLGIGTYGITGRFREGFPGREPSEIFTMHLIGEDLVSDFFLIDKHRHRFESANKKYTRRGWVVKSVEITDKVEEVYCAEVPDGHAFVLEDNILTGNCLGCGQSGRAVEFISLYENLPRSVVAEKINSRFGDDLSEDDYDYEDDLSPILLEGSKYLQKMIQKYKDNPRNLAQIRKAMRWFDFYLMSKAADRHISASELKGRVDRMKELIEEIIYK